MFNSGNRLASFFQFKDKVPLNARSLILHTFTCSSCNSAYVGKTKRHFLVCMFEHLGISLGHGSKHENLKMDTYVYFPDKNMDNNQFAAHICIIHQWKA